MLAALGGQSLPKPSQGFWSPPAFGVAATDVRNIERNARGPEPEKPASHGLTKPPDALPKLPGMLR